MPLASELKYALRMLAKSPGFTAVAVLALALGIGANTAIFSVVNAVLLRSLPYKDPSRLVMIWGDNPNINVGIAELPSTVADLTAWKQERDLFEHVSIFENVSFNVSGDFEPSRVDGASVSEGFFETFGVQAQMGRTLNSSDQVPGSDRTTVISHALWKTRFGGSSSIVGKKIMLNNVPYEVAGVMPASFKYPQAQDLPKAYGFGKDCQFWEPAAFTPEQMRARTNRGYPGVARLKPGVSVAQAHSRIRAVGERIQREDPSSKGWGFKVVSFRDSLVGRVEKLILVMSLAVGFVLLIACANVANLLLARASSRRREMAVRAALGASRAQIVRQLLVESILLSTIAAAAGLALATWSTDLLVKLSPGDIPRLAETNLDWRVLCFTLGLSVFTGLVFGLIPALHVSRVSLNTGLKDGARGSGTGRERHRTRNLLTAAEVALAVVLLVASGLLIRSFVRLQSTDPGFKSDNVLAFDVVLSPAKYDAWQKILGFYDDAFARLQQVPGVQSVGAISNVPLSGAENLDFFVTENMPDPGRGNEPFCDQRRVTPGYFDAAAIPLVAGRNFTPDDRREGQSVSIVNETLAKQHFPNGDALGKRIRYGRFHAPRQEWSLIVGVVRDVRQSSLQTNPRPQVYRPMTQSGNRDMSVLIRGAAEPMQLVPGVRKAIAEIDPQQPISNIRTLQQVIYESVSRERFTMTLMTLFASVAMLLAIIGLYGVLAYGVAQRTQELGVRMALGASRRNVLSLVVGQGMRWVFIGLGIGLTCSLALGRLLSSMLFGVSATDPLTYLGVSLILISVAILAAYIPARRATQVDPISALRYE